MCVASTSKYYHLADFLSQSFLGKQSEKKNTKKLDECVQALRGNSRTRFWKIRDIVLLISFTALCCTLSLLSFGSSDPHNFKLNCIFVSLIL